MGKHFASATELLSVRLLSGEPPEELRFPEGSAAPLQEVLASIASSLPPSLRELPEQDRPRSLRALKRRSLERWAPSRERARTTIKTASMAELALQNGATR